MIRIPTEMDKYINDGRIDIRLDKSNKVLPVEFDKVNDDKLNKNNSIKKNQVVLDNTFQNVLDQEVEKITLK